MYAIAVYRVSREYGGPEEGGWYYDAGSLVRVLQVVRGEDRAFRLCRRANDLLHFLQRNERPISSVLSDGLLSAEVHPATEIPQGYPSGRPVYD